MALRPEDLPSDPARLIEIVLSLDAENDRLRAVIGTFKDMVFGSRSEKLSAVVTDQLALDLADLATDVSLPAAANDDHAPSKPAGTAGKPRKKAQRNIGALPKHLPRCEQVIEPETTACPCCQGRLHKIGQDVSEVLDVIPAILRVLRMIRPKYACRGCEGRSRPGEGLSAADREQHGVDRAGDPCGCLEVRLVSRRCTGRCRSWPVMASISIARPWPAG